MSETSYLSYIADDSFMEGYRQYQQKYALNLRESDRALIDLVRGLVKKSGGQPLSLADIGCSTGNLLRHLKRLVPELKLTGGDMVPAILAQCRRDPELAGIAFEEMDLQNLGFSERFDLITVNAVFGIFRENEFQNALGNIHRALRPQGWLLSFDWFHPFEQDLAILEKSKTHPEGLLLHYRPYSRVRSALEAAGFHKITFIPFEIAIDLPQPKDPAEIITYTKRVEGGGRLQLRGALSQPWCHLLAQKGP